MTIQEVYQRYRITPALQLHQYRVAAIASYLSDNIKAVNKQKKEIVMACLLHDMGNIIKFNMELFPEFFEPEGVEYWQQVKDDFIDKYGTDEHIATIEIAKEVLGDMPERERILDLIDAIGFSNAKRNAESSDYGWKIAAYSDMRVEPQGVTTLESRLRDGNKRFKLNKPGISRHDFFVEMSEYLHRIQAQLFEKLSFTPQSITEDTVRPIIAEIRTFEVAT
ncbi:HD domain-containing protein [Candidatus Roizmanbacteria bacterium]|nr:MAG: HD domain-containing protein [Candidatus Roizmanbacteria bacterium]